MNNKLQIGLKKRKRINENFMYTEGKAKRLAKFEVSLLVVIDFQFSAHLFNFFIICTRTKLPTRDWFRFGFGHHFIDG